MSGKAYVGRRGKITTFKPKKLKTNRAEENTVLCHEDMYLKVSAGHPWVGTVRQEDSPSEWLKFLVFLLTQGRSTGLTSQSPMLQFCAAMSVSLLLRPFWD